MKKLGSMLFVAVSLVLVSAFAWAQEGPLPDVDPQAAGESLIQGISTGAWILIAAGAGLIVIWLLRLLLLPKLTGKALGITSTVLIAVATFGTTILMAPGQWLEAVMAAVTAGLAAGKAWDLIPEAVTDKMEKSIKKRANKGKVGANDEIIG